MGLRSLLQDVLSEVSSKGISFQIELHLLITWVKSSGLFQDYRIFEDMRHGIPSRFDFVEFVDFEIASIKLYIFFFLVLQVQHA